MNRIPLLCFALSLLLPFGASSASAQTEGVGIGATLGVTNGASPSSRNPVGVTGKLWLSDRQAVAGVSSFAVGGQAQSYWMIQGDYLFHNFNALSVGEGLLALYVGGGLQYTILEATSNAWALRSPMGLAYHLGASPIDVFVEAAPTLNITEPASLRFDGGIGFRYYFSLGGGNDGG